MSCTNLTDYLNQTVYTTTSATTSATTWSINNLNSVPYVLTDSVVTSSQAGVVSLNGPDADIVINGESLTQTLREIQNALNILRPNPELEAEWDQLRALGEQYRKLEAELKEKQTVWKILNKK